MEDKLDSYNTLYSCIVTMTKAMSALLPLIAEHIYLGLNPGEKSVHLTDFPKLDEVEIDQELVVLMDRVLDICSTALFIRSAENIRVRQPLATIKIITDSSSKFHDFADLIKDEIFVRCSCSCSCSCFATTTTTTTTTTGTSMCPASLLPAKQGSSAHERKINFV